MCLAAVALDQSPQYPFVCLANRDEFHSRPTAPLQDWPLQGGSVLYAGKDLQSGGSWLGLGSNAEFALLTNVRNSLLNMPNTAPSRGELVIDAIQAGRAPNQADSLKYAGFNLIHGNLTSLRFWCTSNQGPRLGNSSEFSTHLKPGIHSLSNGHLGAAWPKTQWLEKSLQQEMEKLHPTAASLKGFEESLLKLLGNTAVAEDSALPNTGVPYEWEKMLSAVKIVSPLYGTRSSAVIVLDKHNTVHFTEVTFDAAGNEIGRQKILIPLPPKP